MPRDFDGVDDVVNPGEAAQIINLAVFTWACWISPDNQGEGNLGSMMQKGATSTPAKRFFMAATNAISSVVRSAGDASSNSVNNTITMNAWQFVAMTFDNGGDRKIDIFVGTSPSNLSEVSYAAQNAATGTITADSGNDFRIGSLSGGQRAYDGKIAFVTIHNRVLSLNELRTLMAFPGGIANGLVGHWPLWSRGAEPDISGFNLTGSVTGALAVFYDAPPVQGIFLPKRSRFPSYVAPAVAPVPATAVKGQRIKRMLLGVGL